MTTAPDSSRNLGFRDVRDTQAHRHILIARLVAGVPLVVMGLAHVFVSDAAMRPMVEAAGFPFPGVIAPIGVAMQIVGGLLILVGLWARVGALLGVVTMLGAVYAHIAIETWPAGQGPPDALPVVTLLGSAYVLWRGAGLWSLDRRSMRTTTG